MCCPARWTSLPDSAIPPRIAAVLPKPKSANDLVLEQTAMICPCVELDRVLFADPAWLTEYVRCRAAGRRIVLSDVGGYFAPALSHLGFRVIVEQLLDIRGSGPRR